MDTQNKMYILDGTHTSYDKRMESITQISY